jgi:hypothetical protein
MNMNPWLAEQLAAERMSDLEGAADGARRAWAADPEALSAPRPPRRALARHVGALLISVGRRLADPEAFPTAFGTPHQR